MTSESEKPRDDWSFPILGVFLLNIVVALLAIDFLPEWWANHFYAEGRCVLLDKRVVEHPRSGKAVNSTYRPEFLIRYTVDGQEYQVWAYKAVRSSSALRWPKDRLLEDYTIGQEYPCWYDPADPFRVVFIRGYSWLSYTLLAALVVLLVLIVRGFRRALRSARRATGDASSGAILIRAGEGLTNVTLSPRAAISPGTRGGRTPPG